MASSIDASTSGAGGIISTADNTGILQLKTAGTTAVTVDASQNVGIGTASPTGNLDIASSSNVNVYIRQTTGVCNTIIKSDSTNAAIGTSTDHQFSLLQNNTEAVSIDTSKNLKFNSGYGSVATAYGCRAWVNFNGTGTVAIRGSGNVSSITDNGTGDYTINFTTAMPNVNYAFTQHISCASTGALNDGCDWQSIATGSFRILCGQGGTALDADYAMFSIFR
jgi:uncharacterized protein (AIM24 family)